MKKERILYFDLIKLAATLCVFVCHFTRSLEANGAAFDFKILPDNIFTVYLGSFGVSLFFIVSGAALMYVYDEKIDVKTYLVKRLKGIYPLFWLTYLFAFFISFYNNAGVAQGIPKYRIIYSVLGCDGNMLWFGSNFYLVGEWFLSVIVMLYLIFPLIRAGVKKSPYAVIGISVLLFFILLKIWNSAMPLECFFLSRLPEFVFGMFFIKVIKKPKIWLCAGGGILLAAAFLFGDKFLNINSVIRTEVIGISAFCVLSYLFKWFRGKFITDISIFVDKYTYGFFLSHHFIQMEVLRKFSGKYLHRIDVVLSCVLCLTLTVFATILLNKINTNILQKITRIKINNQENKAQQDKGVKDSDVK